MNPSQNAWRTLWREQTASVAIESAFAFVMLVFVMICVISIADFIMTRERLNRAANQVAQVLASGHNYCEYSGSVFTGHGIDAPTAGNHMGYNYQQDFLSADIYYCKNGVPGQGLSEALGHCGFGGGAAMLPFLPPGCSGAYAQSVAVTYSCAYTPLLDPFGWTGTVLTASIEVPLRYPFLQQSPNGTQGVSVCR